MARPIYQSKDDLANEDRIIKRVVEMWRYRGVFGHRKLCEGAYRVDQALYGAYDRVLCFAEVKCRDLPFGFGDGFWLSLHKVEAAVNLWHTGCVPVLFIGEFKGELAYFDFAKARPTKVVLDGRRDRDDPKDVEPLAVFDWKDFKPVVGEGK